MNQSLDMGIQPIFDNQVMQKISAPLGAGGAPRGKKVHRAVRRHRNHNAIVRFLKTDCSYRGLAIGKKAFTLNGQFEILSGTASDGLIQSYVNKQLDRFGGRRFSTGDRATG